MLRHLLTFEAPLPLPDQPPLSAAEFCLVSIDLDDLRRNLQEVPSDPFHSFWLAVGEQHFYSRLSLAKRRLEWLGGRMAAKTALLHLAAGDQELQPPSFLQILPTSTGRPFCRPPLLNCRKRPLAFSISHSGNSAAALAVAGFSCGLDIQVVSPSLETIRQKFCSPQERTCLRESERLASLQKTQQLALLWCAKEAFRKTLTVRPLPGFQEIELHRKPLDTGTIFSLPMRFRRPDSCIDFTAITWLRGNLASALTIIPDPGE